MVYRLLASRVHYQTSKYAPVAVICVDIDNPGETVPVFSRSQVFANLNQFTEGRTGEVQNPTGKESLSDIYRELVLMLQRSAGHAVAYSRSETLDSANGHRVFVEYEDHATALYAADVALDLLNSALENRQGIDAGTTSALQRQLDEYIVYAQARRLDPNTRLLRKAARQQGIPAISLDPFWGAPTWPGAAESTGIVQYGWGIKQRQCRGALPLGTLSPRQFQQCLDRSRLLPALKRANLPIAAQDLEFTSRNHTRRAQRSARRIGYPVVLRPKVAALPQYGFLDNGAFGPLHDDEQVALVTAYLRDQVKTDIWVESYVKGDHYRFLILGGEVVSVLRFAAPAVVGDGMQTIAALIQSRVDAAKDASTRQAWQNLEQADGSMVCRLKVAGLDKSSVPATDELVALRAEGNYYNGGKGVEVFDQVPSRFIAVALKAAVASGVEQVVGVDLVIDDLQGAAGMPNCAVTAVDPVPDLVSHSELSESNVHQIPERFFAELFPTDNSASIPSVSVTGTNGKTTTCRMVARILRESGLKVGLTCSDGIYLDDDVALRGDEAGVLGAIEVLTNPEMEAAVLETARGNMANTGIAFDRVDVGACLNIAADHLGDEGIDTLDQMAAHKRQVIERSSKAVVLNAEDSRCAAMRGHAAANEVILFACDPDNPEVIAHVESGGSAVVVDDLDGRPGIVFQRSRGEAIPVIAIGDIPATEDGTVLYNVQNALAAVGIAIGLGVSVDHISNGLMHFILGVNTTPGRLNWIRGFSFDVLVDAAHNPHGMRHLLEYVRRYKVDGKKTIIFGARAALPEQAIRKYTAQIASDFDLYVLRNYRPAGSPGPLLDEILGIIRSELVENGVPESAIVVEPGVLDAVDRGIECSGSGDLLVVQVPAGGNDKWDMIDRIRGSRHRGTAESVSSQATDLVPSDNGDSDLRLFLGGDVMLGRGIDQILPNPGNPGLHEHWRNISDAREFLRLAQQKHGVIDHERDISYVWGDVLVEIEKFDPDLSLINLETTITTHDREWPKKPVHYRMNPQNIGVLQHACVDFCALANNHVMDWGRAGLKETIDTLDQAGIRHAGAGSRARDAESPAMFEVPNKARVMVVSMGTTSSGIPGAWAARDDQAGVNLVELNDHCIEAIQACLEKSRQPGDILVASIHWGSNYEAVIPQKQREFARQLIDIAGVDIVHGHSSHHVRGIELYRGKLVLYGCGDLVNDYEGVESRPEHQALAPDLGLTYFAQVSAETGNLTGLTMIPTKMHRLRVVRGDADDAERLARILNKECLELGTVVVNVEGVLHLKVMNG